MCNTCNNTGGITTEHSWGLQMHPCPNSDCDINQKERAELISHIDAMLIKLRGRASA